MREVRSQLLPMDFSVVRMAAGATYNPNVMDIIDIMSQWAKMEKHFYKC
jgi:hypothetical protein